MRGLNNIVITIFSSLMIFICIACFVYKANDKTPPGISYILTECREATIDFDIQQDIQEMTDSINDLNNNTSSGSNDIFGYVKSIALNIYYTIRFAVKMFIHTFISGLNIVILCLRCLGFDALKYVSLTGGGLTGASGQLPENLHVLFP